MDNAIWHKSSTLKIPTNIGFAFIPPYTPEMNPLNKCGKEKEVIKSIVNRRWTRMLFESR
ncbi:transposase [Streptococcus pneumoniae]|nr:transposase [Streptococcus pneumoniae]